MSKVGWKEVLIAGYVVIAFIPIQSLQYLYPHEPLVRGPWRLLWLFLVVAVPAWIAGRIKKARMGREAKPTELR